MTYLGRKSDDETNFLHAGDWVKTICGLGIGYD